MENHSSYFATSCLALPKRESWYGSSIPRALTDGTPEYVTNYGTYHVQGSTVIVTRLHGRGREQMFVVTFHNATQIQRAPEKTAPARKKTRKMPDPTNSITASTLQTSSPDHRHPVDLYSSSYAAQWPPSAAAEADPGA